MLQFVSLSTQDNAKLLKQLKSDFKRTINWDNYQSKLSSDRQNQHLDFLNDPIFQGINRFFGLSFENEAQRISYKSYCLRTVELKSYNVMIDGQTFFNQPVRNDLITNDNNQKLLMVKEMIMQLIVC